MSRIMDEYINKLAEALKKYGRHDLFFCATNNLPVGDKCTCGFEQVLALAKEKGVCKTCKGNNIVWRCERCGRLYAEPDELETIGSETSCCRNCGCEDFKNEPCPDCQKEGGK